MIQTKPVWDITVGVDCSRQEEDSVIRQWDHGCGEKVSRALVHCLHHLTNKKVTQIRLADTGYKRSSLKRTKKGDPIKIEIRRNVMAGESRGTPMDEARNDLRNSESTKSE
jgi:hypothetical protein